MNIVDKAEYRIKLEQINNLAENGDFKGAAAIADTIEWKRVKSVRTLCMIGEIYEANRRYSDSEQILKYAYRQSSTSKTVLYRLAEIEIRMGFYDEAKKYYQEFEELSPHDTSRYILKYKLLRAQGAPLSEQIEVLREYKEREYTERWAFELARLYKKNGQKQRCIEECDDMILWFAEGKYVTRAMELKMQLEPLSEAQQKRYDNRHKAAIEAERRAIPDDDLNGFDRVQRAINRADEEDYELRPERQKKVTAAEAIQKMNAAADEAVTTAIFEEKTPNVRPGIRTGRGIGRSSDIQDQIASSFREAVSSIRKPRQIDYTDLYSEEEEPGEDFKESFEESREDRGNAELEALFAETGSMFAKELADTFGVRSGSAFEIEKDEETTETETPEEPEAVTAEEETAADQAESADVTEEAEEAKAENESAGETEESLAAPSAEEICEDQAEVSEPAENEVSEAAENEESEAAEAEDDAASETEEQEAPESFEDIESGTAAEEAEDASSDEEIAEKPEYDITEPEIEGSFADLADTLEPVDPTEAAGMIEEIDRSLVEGVDEDFDLSSLTEDEDIAENDDVAEDEDVADHTEETVETVEEAAETAAGDIDEAAENIQDDIEETAEAIEEADEEAAEAEVEEAEEIAEAIEEADEEAAEAEAEEAEETAEAIEETAEESDDVAVEAEAEAEEIAEAIEESGEEAAEAEAEAEEIAEAIEESGEEAAEAEAAGAEEIAEAIEEADEEAVEAETEDVEETAEEMIEEAAEAAVEAEAEEAEEIVEAAEEAVEAEEEVEEITEAFEEATEEAAETDLESADDTAEAEEEAADSDAGTAFYKPEEPTAEESVEPILGTEEVEEITAGDSDDADIPCEKRSSNEFVQEEEIPDSGSIDSAEDAEFDEEYYEPYDLEAEAEALREFGEAFSEIEKEAAEISENAAESQPFTPSEKIGEVIAPIIYDSENAAEEAAVREELKAEAEELTKADEVFAEELAEAGEVFTEELAEAGDTYTEALEKADDVLVKKLEKADEVLVRELPLADEVFTKELADAKETLAEDPAEEIAAEESAEAGEIEELTAEEPAEAEEVKEVSAEEPAEAEEAEEPAQEEAAEETSAEESAEAEEAITEEPAEPEAAEETESEKSPEFALEEPSESAAETVSEEKPYARKIRPVTEESVVQEIAEGTQDVLEETVPEAVWASLSRRMASAVERMSARTASAMAWDKESDSYDDEELLSTIEPEEESEPTEGLTKAVPEFEGEAAAEPVKAVEETAEELEEPVADLTEEAVSDVAVAVEETMDEAEAAVEAAQAEEITESVSEAATEEIDELEEAAEAAEEIDELEEAAEAAEEIDELAEAAEEIDELEGAAEAAAEEVDELEDAAEAAEEIDELEDAAETAEEIDEIEDADEEVDELEEAEEAAEEIEELEEAEEAAEEVEEIKDEAEDIEEIEDTVVAAEEIEEIEDTVEAAEAAEETEDAAENEEIIEEAEESADAADEAEQADIEVSGLSADEILKSMEVPTAGVDPEELWRPVVSPEETETLLGRETDESLGLTREFNFQEELRKARAGDITLEEAAKLVYEKAEAEADSTREGKTEHTAFFLSPEEEARKTVMEAAGKEFPVAEPEEEDMTPVPEEPVKIEEEPEEPKVSIKKESAPIPIGEIPKEIFADESDEFLPDEAAEDVSDILSAEEGSFGRDTNIIEHIMTEPEMVNRVPVLPRKFDETERKIFSYFSNIPGMQEQITLALADIHNNSGDKTSRSGNVLIIGRQKSGKTKLAEGIMLAVCKDLHIQAAKKAKIIATDLNKKDPAKIVKLLAGGFLLIEGAGSMYDETIEKLSKAMEFRTDGLVVILEDEKRDMRAMLNSHPELAEKFTSTIIVPVFTNDELVTFARTYARENGYKFDELATLALYTLIGDNQKDSEPMTVGMVKELVDQAIDHSKSRRFGFRSKNQSTPDGRILLREKDFS